MHFLLDDTEELFHGIVEDIKIRSSSDNVFIYDLGFFGKFIGTSMKKFQEVIVLIVFLFMLFAILDGGYRF
jgi:hypothetical protein